MLFDYDNPTHEKCPIVGFKVGNGIKRISVPGDRVNDRVQRWLNSPGKLPRIVRINSLAIPRFVVNSTAGNASQLLFP